MLVVEDDPALRDILTRWLKSDGFAVTQAESLETAVRAVLSWGPFELVISDYQLPDGTGLVFKRWLREQVIAIPFILMSGSLDSAPLRPNSRFDFLQKPFTLDQLREAVGRMLDHGGRRAVFQGVDAERRRAKVGR